MNKVDDRLIVAIGLIIAVAIFVLLGWALLGVLLCCNGILFMFLRTSLRRFGGLVGLPTLIGLALALYGQIPIWTAPQPLWTETPKALARPEQASSDTSASSISSSQAQGIADAVILRASGRNYSGVYPTIGGVYFGDGIILYSRGPRLISATLPDGTTRLAWSRFVMTDMGSSPTHGTGPVVYVDAQTAQPLWLISGTFALAGEGNTLGEPGKEGNSANEVVFLSRWLIMAAVPAWGLSIYSGLLVLNGLRKIRTPFYRRR